MRFSDIDFGDSHGIQPWDYPLNRGEVGIGYKIDRAVIIKLVSQITRVPDNSNLDDNILAIQFHVKKT